MSHRPGARRGHREGRSSAVRSSIPAFLIPFVVVVFCGFVFWLAFPLFLNSLIAQKSIETIAALKQGQDVSEARLWATLEAIGPIDPDRPAMGDRLINQGILTLALALRLPANDTERFDLLRQAAELAESRLQEASADTHTWARLAVSEYYLNGPSELTFEALRMSYATGPSEYYLLWSRLRLGIFLWDQLDEDLKQNTIAQAVLLWRVPHDRRQLVRYLFDMPEDAAARISEQLQEMDDHEAFQAMFEQELQRQNR